MGRRISKEFLHPSILEGVDNKIGNLDNLETDAKDNMVQAINELADKINTEIVEGKELIASAIGEPLNVEDTFNTMGNDINSLLNTFKTNMMNNGVTVENGDKFKQLIDKIATLADNEGKGIQFAMGEQAVEGLNVYDLDFTPNYIFVEVTDSQTIYAWQANYLVSNLNTAGFSYSRSGEVLRNTQISITDISNTSFNIYIYDKERVNFGKWYAIGVGEEDTTLRDSLASILQEEGVSVTEEDDMASLISKVDNKFTDIKQLLVDRAASKGISASTNEDYDTLLNKSTTLTMKAGTSGNYLMTYFNKNICPVNVGSGSCTGTMEFDESKFYIKSLSITFTGDNAALNVRYSLTHIRNGVVISTIASGETKSEDPLGFTKTYTIEDVKYGDAFVLTGQGTGGSASVGKNLRIKGTAILDI